MPVLRRGINELQVDGLGVGSASGSDDALTHGDRSLARSTNASLEHEPVLIDNAVVRESTNGGNRLLSQIGLGRSRLGVVLMSNPQDSLVYLSAVEITLLTSTCNSGCDTGRVPSANTSNLAKTTMSLARKAGNTPTADHTGITMAAGGRADVDGLTLGEHLLDADLLLKERAGKVDLGIHIPAVNLDLQKIGNLLSKLDLVDLGVGKDADNLAVVLNSLHLSVDILWLFGALLGVLAEGFSLGSVPVLVKSALNLIRQMASEHSGQGAEAIGGLDVSDNADNSHRGRLHNGDCLHGFLLVKLGAGALDLSDNVGHAGLVTDEGGQVARLGGVVAREGTNPTSMVFSPLLRSELEVAAAGVLEFTVRHVDLIDDKIMHFYLTSGAGVIQICSFSHHHWKIYTRTYYLESCVDFQFLSRESQTNTCIRRQQT